MESLQKANKQLHTKLCKLIKEMLRGDPAAGIGKPEQLKHQYQGLWSRRISAEDRVVYRFDDDAVYLFAIGGNFFKLVSGTEFFLLDLGKVSL